MEVDEADELYADFGSPVGLAEGRKLVRCLQELPAPPLALQTADMVAGVTLPLPHLLQGRGPTATEQPLAAAAGACLLAALPRLPAA